MFRPYDAGIIGSESQAQNGQRNAGPLTDPETLHPEICQPAPQAWLRRRVDEPAFLQSFDALSDNAVRNVEALALVKGAQSRDKLLVASLLVEFSLDKTVAMAKGVYDVHSHHQIVKFSRSRLLFSPGEGLLCHQSGRALPSATSFAIRRLPSSTASRISAELLVACLRISSMIC